MYVIENLEFMIPTLSSVAVPQVVIMTTCVATSDNKFGIIMIQLCKIVLWYKSDSSWHNVYLSVSKRDHDVYKYPGATKPFTDMV